MTTVIFYHEKDGENVFAFFPSNNSCYAHIGQHGNCSSDYLKECKEANYAEYESLLKELISIGYSDLIVSNQEWRELHRKPTHREIKFGEGATHYREFQIGVLINKNGELKKWHFAHDEQLRYYR